VRALPFPFTLTGRVENFLRGRPDLDDTIKRLKAYEAAGADALMAPGLPDLESVRGVYAATAKPFNFMVEIKGKSSPSRLWPRPVLSASAWRPRCIARR
jgi:2-methylisocitrate lyase-like PEP mutase family enzyme